MSSSLLVAIEFTLVVGIVLGLAVWELLRLRRDLKRDAEQRESPGPERR
jgi:hypothetical protein